MAAGIGWRWSEAAEVGVSGSCGSKRRDPLVGSTKQPATDLRRPLLPDISSDLGAFAPERLARPLVLGELFRDQGYAFGDGALVSEDD